MPKFLVIMDGKLQADFDHPTKGMLKRGTPTQGHIQLEAKDAAEAKEIAKRVNPEYDKVVSAKKL